MTQTFYHIQTSAAHTEGLRPFVVGQTQTIGGGHNPYYSSIRISATRQRADVSSTDVLRHYAVMLRESVFENIRLKNYASLPSRNQCIWLTDSLPSARYWMGRIPHHGEKRLLEVAALDGMFHQANEGHLTNGHENIDEIEQRAHQYWKGEPGTGRSEILFVGKLTVIREHV
jgi:hypothetical protein